MRLDAKSWQNFLKFVRTDGLTRVSRDVSGWGFAAMLFAWMTTSASVTPEVSTFFAAAALSLAMGWIVFAQVLHEDKKHDRDIL